MKTSFELVAESRNDQGKGASRRLRRSGRVPAILYGGHQEARSLSLDHTRLMLMLDNERFYSTILSLDIGGQKQPAVLKDLQRHPYKNQVVHIDFQRVLDNEPIRMRIPLHFINEATSIGVKTQSGVVSHLRSDIEVSCLPKDLPEYIEVDLQELQIGQIVHLSELKLPEGVQITDLLHGNDAGVVSIHAPRAAAEEAAPAAVAAPAAGAAPAAAPAKAAPAKK
ncbi:MAG: 50S ribosomal protein L25/general stress protein Ctc [Steroidobacteraceae bacterium]